MFLTFKDLSDILRKNNVPEDVRLMSDSGWECGSTDMCGIWYNKADNTVVFTQHGSESEEKYYYGKDWVLLNSDKW